MSHNHFLVNWILAISSFIILNYNLYNLICSFSLFSVSYLHNFFYYILYYYDLQLFDILLNKYNGHVNLTMVHWMIEFPFNILFAGESFNEILNDFYSLLDSVVISSTYCIYFDTKVIGSNSIIFYSLQNKIFVIVGETTLSFFRIVNNYDDNIYGIPIYIISPFEFSTFITKIQCFCFEELFIFPYEVIELPVLFYINSNVNSLFLYKNNELTLEYVFFCNVTS